MDLEQHIPWLESMRDDFDKTIAQIKRKLQVEATTVAPPSAQPLTHSVQSASPPSSPAAAAVSLASSQNLCNRGQTNQEPNMDPTRTTTSHATATIQPQSELAASTIQPATHSSLAATRGMSFAKQLASIRSHLSATGEKEGVQGAKRQPVSVQDGTSILQNNSSIISTADSSRSCSQSRTASTGNTPTVYRTPSPSADSPVRSTYYEMTQFNPPKSTVVDPTGVTKAIMAMDTSFSEQLAKAIDIGERYSAAARAKRGNFGGYETSSFARSPRGKKERSPSTTSEDIRRNSYVEALRHQSTMLDADRADYVDRSIVISMPGSGEQARQSLEHPMDGRLVRGCQTTGTPLGHGVNKSFEYMTASPLQLSHGFGNVFTRTAAETASDVVCNSGAASSGTALWEVKTPITETANASNIDLNLKASADIPLQSQKNWESRADKRSTPGLDINSTQGCNGLGTHSTPATRQRSFSKANIFADNVDFVNVSTRKDENVASYVPDVESSITSPSSFRSTKGTFRKERGKWSYQRDTEHGWGNPDNNFNGRITTEGNVCEVVKGNRREKSSHPTDPDNFWGNRENNFRRPITSDYSGWGVTEGNRGFNRTPKNMKFLGPPFEDMTQSQSNETLSSALWVTGESEGAGQGKIEPASSHIIPVDNRPETPESWTPSTPIVCIPQAVSISPPAPTALTASTEGSAKRAHIPWLSSALREVPPHIRAKTNLSKGRLIEGDCSSVNPNAGKPVPVIAGVEWQFAQSKKILLF